MLVENTLSLSGPVLLGEAVIEDDAEDETGSGEISHHDLLRSKECSLLFLKGKVEEISNSLDSSHVNSLSILVELLAKN